MRKLLVTKIPRARCYDTQGIAISFAVTVKLHHTSADFSTCRHFIRTIPNLVYDESNVEDIDTRQEDHIYDECRYVLMEHPIAPPRQKTVPPLRDDPLELHKRARVYRV